MNDIECFWNFAKSRLAKFNGLSSESFVLHLKKESLDSITEEKTYFPFYPKFAGDLLKILVKTHEFIYNVKNRKYKIKLKSTFVKRNRKNLKSYLE